VVGAHRVLAVRLGDRDHPAPAAPVAAPDIVGGQLVLGFAPEIDEAARDRIVGAQGGVTLARLAGIDARVVASRPGRPLGEEARAYATVAGVRYAEPHYRYHTARVPNDTRYTDPGLWGLATIGAPAAWDHTVGDQGIVVGVVDSGIDYRHSDLKDNMWSAPPDWTLPGCAPGTHGYQAVGTNVGCEPLDTYNSGAGHGTQIAGTIGAVGNNGVGIAGVNWQVGLMALRCMADDGTVQLADAVRVLDYAVAARRAGVNLRVLAIGWGSPSPSEALRAALVEAATIGILVVAPAGDTTGDNDQTPFYPASYGSAPANLPNVIAVAATTKVDARPTEGNTGAASVHLGAPGAGILSTVPNDRYTTYSGSQAAAHVAGAAALTLAAAPTVSVGALKGRLLACGTPREALYGLTITGRRLNLAQSVTNTGCDYRLALEATPSGGTVSAAPNSGYRFVGWQGDGADVGAANPLALTITADRRVFARFVRSYTVTVDVHGGGTATMSLCVSVGSCPIPALPALQQPVLPRHLLQRVGQDDRALDLVLEDRDTLDIQPERQGVDVLVVEDRAQVRATDRDRAGQRGRVVHDRRGGSIGDRDAEPAQECQRLLPPARDERQDDPARRHAALGALARVIGE